jgi:MinD-like ATPase involved in chromosome partitioning or flagellar assembly
MATESVGEVITFYSYKGGTGRTMALANVACLLARRPARFSSEGILMIDWDLEAPGLHRFFQGKFQRLSSDSNKREKLIQERLGLIDLFEELNNLTASIAPTSEEQDEDFAAAVLNRVNFESYILDTDIPGLSLLKAGRFDNHYASRVNTFDWEALYKRCPSLFRCLAERLSIRYKYILIDSRTGLTDISGICTSLMPTLLVVVFTPNRQSLTGLVDLVQRAAKYRKQSSDLRPLVVFPLPSRIEANEPILREQWRFGDPKLDIPGYQPRFESLFRQVYDLDECRLDRYFEEVQIQHIPRYAYGEEIAALTERDDRFSLTRSYKSLVERLAQRTYPWRGYSTPEPIPSPGPLPPGSHVPLLTDPSFVNREEELRSLAAALKSGSIAQPVVAVVGQAGIGKTQLAVEYAYRYGKLYEGGVFWLRVTDKDTARHDAERCGRAAGLFGKNGSEAEDSANEAEKFMTFCEQGPAKLLILDEVYDRGLAHEWLPKNILCSVILTSRNAELSEVAAKTISVGPLPRESSLEILTKARPVIATDQNQRSVADAICDLLADSPLALSMASAHLSGDRAESLDTFLSALKRAAQDSSGQRHPLWLSFSAIYAKLSAHKELGETACQLLYRWPYYSTSKKELASSQMFHYRNEKDRNRVNEAVALLADSGLIFEDPAGRISIHPVVQGFIHSLPIPEDTTDKRRKTRVVIVNGLGFATAMAVTITIFIVLIRSKLDSQTTAVGVSGVLGGYLSAMLETGRSWFLGTELPHWYLKTLLILPIIGCVSALLVYFFLTSFVLQARTSLSIPGLTVLALVIGFFVSSALARIVYRVEA